MEKEDFLRKKKTLFALFFQKGLLSRPRSTKVDPVGITGIYEVLLKQKVMKRESFIPSRSEKRNPGIKFKCSWGNLLLVKSVNPVLKYFAWCCIQDMVVVGERKHRRNQDKNCHMEITNQITGEQTECGVRESLRHAMWECQVSSSKEAGAEQIAQHVLV